MKKVLIINTVGFEYDGITSVILNYINGMNREDISFVFPIYDNVASTLKESLNLLGNTVIIPDRKKNIVGYVCTLYRFLKECYDVIHIHGNSGTMLIEVLLAKLCGAKKILVHAHSTKTSHPIINWVMKQPMIHLADICLACSKAAGDWLYGNHPYTVLNNAIDLSKFQFSEASRAKYRDEFGIKEEFLIGHIGYFAPVKNHSFLIDVFYEFHRAEPNSKLLLISDGPLLVEIQDKVINLGLQENVIFAGRRNDIAEIYSAMDLFILPSLWEGLPLTMVEAQANGLPLLVSDVITRDAECTNRVVYKALTDGAASWARMLQVIQEQKCARNCDVSQELTEIGMNIKTEAEKLREIYLEEKYDG